MFTYRCSECSLLRVMTADAICEECHANQAKANSPVAQAVKACQQRQNIPNHGFVDGDWYQD